MLIMSNNKSPAPGLLFFMILGLSKIRWEIGLRPIFKTTFMGRRGFAPNPLKIFAPGFRITYDIYGYPPELNGKAAGLFAEQAARFPHIGDNRHAERAARLAVPAFGAFVRAMRKA